MADDWMEDAEVDSGDEYPDDIPNATEMNEEGTQEPTQPTQIVMDPRRLGRDNPMLSLEDQGDVVCILVPQSAPAVRAVELMYESHPDRTITFGKGVNIRVREREEPGEPHAWADGTPRNLVLRLSANLKDPAGGWYFGRHKARCDFPIGWHEESKRVSNVHFRIYVNEHGTLMLEDQSTNGTVVDGTLLRGKDKENAREMGQFSHTLSNGNIVLLTMTPPDDDYRFVVVEPQRDDEGESIYESNLIGFFLRANDARKGNEARLAAGGAKGEPPNLFPTPASGTPLPLSMSGRAKAVKEWKGGDRYNKVSTIGKGAFATVYKLLDKFNGVPYAAKELEKRRFIKNGVVDAKVENEMNIMKKIHHPSIVQYIEAVDYHDHLYIIMEYIPGGDLGSLINEQGSLPELQVKLMAEQLIGALGYLHERGITHRDVKPDNILIAHRDPFHIKLTDFGLSKMIDSDETFLRTFCGTLLYCAPEVYSEYREYDDSGRRFRGIDKRELPPQRYGNAVDVWSAAGVLFFALCASPPYPVKNGTSYQELLNQIMTQALDIRPLQLAGVSDDGIRFVRRMLHIRPEYRATIDEMKRSAWVRGYHSFELSRSSDEVDMVGGYNGSQLEEGASQLSIQDERQINDSQDDDSDITDIKQPEVPGSFDTSEAFGADESYAFMQENIDPSKGRLFGEVGVSALGSSGAIPDRMNFPLANREPVRFSEDSDYLSQPPESFNSRLDPQLLDSNPPSAMPTDMPPPPPRSSPTTQYPANEVPIESHKLNDDRSVRSSSLLGTESMVGHLNMHSPAFVASPSADSPMTSTEPRDIKDVTTSLRRPRDETQYDDDGDWRPADLPAKRQRRSSREIELEVPPSVFWDPKDRSTHHTNYPRMSTTDFNAFQDYAKSKGENFLPGEKTFESTMQSFRSASQEPDAATRAFSEPTKEEGRRMLMKRDERQLASALSSINTNQGGIVNDPFIPTTARSMGAPGPPSANAAPQSADLPRVGNDFQPPKRIIAKLSTTPDSVISTININITDSVTSWGRGVATIRYPQASEVRIPKYAFKIALFKPDFYTKLFGQEPREWKDADQDMKAYISTKASQGIWVNGVFIPSHNCQEPDSESKFWTELRHGDEITIWHMDKTKNRNEENNRLRFECFWGASKEPRNGQPVECIKEGDFLNELEHVTIVYEHRIIKEKQRRAEEEKKALKLEKEKEELAGAGPASA